MQHQTDEVLFHPALLATPKQVVLTPNRRLAAHLQQEYATYQQAQNIACWETPDILPLSSWLVRQWQRLTSQDFADFPMLLSVQQERILWQQVITQSHGDSLLRIQDTAEKVKSAYELIIQWQLDLQHPSFQQTQDSLALYHWVLTFQQLCQTKNWLPVVLLPEKLQAAIVTGQLQHDEKIYLYGFTELAPQLSNFLNDCYGYQHLSLAPQTMSKKQRVTAKNSHGEIYMVAHWAKTSWLTNPKEPIACVFPNLDKIRDKVQQIFSDVFADTDQTPFNISAGKRLCHYPVIQTALQLLKWQHQLVATEHFCDLITSPFLGDSESEFLARSYYNVILREKNICHLRLTEILDKGHSLSLWQSMPRLADRLTQFLANLPSQDTVLSYAKVIQLIESLLRIIGWPGERSLTSDEYQTVENWLKVLADCQSLDNILPPTNFRQALEHIQQITAQTMFQARTPSVNIQILGLLEAAGIPFSAVWIAGLDDITWPPAAAPNPFIPKSLQRQLQMPHSTTERELNFCYKLLAQFDHACPQIIFSHASKDESIEKNVSPLIANVAEIAYSQLVKNQISDRNEIIYQSKALEKILDNIGPPLQDHEKVRGGINILKHQALCPFRAFAHWRLHAHPLDDTAPGLRHKDRGVIIHKALEAIWHKLQNHHTLINMRESDLKLLIDEVVHDSLQTLQEHYVLRPQYFNLESLRLQQILLNWLDVEKMREPFHVISQEEKMSLQINNLQFAFRVDRIDQLDNGKKLVIDYKTGQSNSVHNWFSDRPADPQLPLYLLQDINNTIGITFAQVLPGHFNFKGVSATDVNIKGINTLANIKTELTEWHEQVQQWQQVFEKLSTDFTLGFAQVDPKEGEQTCHFCALNPLCRINERNL